MAALQHRNFLLLIFLISFLNPFALQSEPSKSPLPGMENIGVGQAGFLVKGQRPPYYQMEEFPFRGQGSLHKIKVNEKKRFFIQKARAVVFIYPLRIEKPEKSQDFKVQFDGGSFHNLSIKDGLNQSEVLSKRYFSLAQTPLTFEVSHKAANAYLFKGKNLNISILSSKLKNFYLDIQELDGPQIDLKLKKFFFSQSSFINFYVSLRKGGEDYTLNKVDFQIFPADADHPLGYDPEQNLKKYWSITHTPKIISLNIKKGYFKTLRPHYGIWNAIISLQLGYKSEKIKRTIQTRFAIQSESGVRLVGKSLSFKDKQMQLEIELNAPLKGNYRVGANLLGLKSQELAFCWQEKVLKQGSNKVILPIPKKYLSLNKSLAVKIPKKEDYKIVDIEVFSPALAPKSTYFYFP